MIIQQEHYNEILWAELLPLVQRNWRESPSYEPGLEADPAAQQYAQMDAEGRCICMTLRDGRKLVGYAIFMVTKSLHHQTMTVGVGDAIYLLEGYRGHTMELLRAAERRMRELGVERVGWWVDEQSSLLNLLTSFGYRRDEVLMEKVL